MGGGRVMPMLVLLLALCVSGAATAQTSGQIESTRTQRWGDGISTTGQTRNAQYQETDMGPLDPSNPMSVLDYASRNTPAGQDAARDGDDTGGLSSSLSIILLLTLLSLAPSMLVMCTSFTRIIVVLALLRQAMGTQTLPPAQVITGLSLFLTFLVMSPTFDRVNQECVIPLQNHQFDSYDEAWQAARAPLRDFMIANIENAGNEQTVFTVLDYRGIDTSRPELLDWERDVDMLSLVPSFILSELKVAFLMGFRLYLPFLIIDMVVASVLISMGMLMLPPVLISLPFKLLLFVLVDGWRLVAGNLLDSFVQTRGAETAMLVTQFTGFT